jgi:hypothetical protein
MDTGINVGTTVDKASLEALTSSLIAIMSANADQETIRFAIAVLERAAKVEQVVVRDCSIVGDRTVHVNIDPEGNAKVETSYDK